MLLRVCVAQATRRVDLAWIIGWGTPQMSVLGYTGLGGWGGSGRAWSEWNWGYIYKYIYMDVYIQNWIIHQFLLRVPYACTEPLGEFYNYYPPVKSLSKPTLASLSSEVAAYCQHGCTQGTFQFVTQWNRTCMPTFPRSTRCSRSVSVLPSLLLQSTHVDDQWIDFHPDQSVADWLQAYPAW